MSQFPHNTTTDEYSYPPFKKGINSFYLDNKNSCMSPYGPVSNLNCPASDPYCQCPTKIAELQPTEQEPTDAFLAELKNTTSECSLIKDNFHEDWINWIGIDYSNPRADYNCTNCVGISGGLGFTGIDKVSDDWSPYFGITIDNTTTDTTQQLVAAPTTDVKYYYNYDKRKLFGSGGISGGITSTFPPQSSEIVDTTVDCGDKSLIGRYFKYYKEYSKTAATFWNTPPKTPLYRKAQTALMGTQRIKILVHGNLQVRPGKMVYIDYYNFGGRWMVYKVQRVITAQKHSMYLYLMRDGVS